MSPWISRLQSLLVVSMLGTFLLGAAAPYVEVGGEGDRGSFKIEAAETHQEAQESENPNAVHVPADTVTGSVANKQQNAGPQCLDGSGAVDSECVDETADACDPGEILTTALPVFDLSITEPGSDNVTADPCIEFNVDRPELFTNGPPEEQVDITDRPDLVASEFARINMPLPEPRFQEEIEDQVVPGRMWGAGWRQTDVNMWVIAEDHTTTVTLLGTDVTIRATPLKYTWDYGDGQTRTTAFAGQKVHTGSGPAHADTETATSHSYEETGFYPVSVTTVYAGQFRTPTSDWIPIPGVAVVTSDPKTLTIWKSETRLVASDCGDDHSAWGCARIPFPWEGGRQTSEAYKAERARLEGR